MAAFCGFFCLTLAVVMNSATQQHNQQAVGRWVTAKLYGEIFGFSENTLASWRYQDDQVGRKEARPGYPIYQRFGKSVRYWLPDGSYDPNMLASMSATRYKPRKKTVQAAVTA